jgi:hypothetical protein
MCSVRERLDLQQKNKWLEFLIDRNQCEVWHLGSILKKSEARATRRTAMVSPLAANAAFPHPSGGPNAAQQAGKDNDTIPFE